MIGANGNKAALAPSGASTRWTCLWLPSLQRLLLRDVRLLKLLRLLLVLLLELLVIGIGGLHVFRVLLLLELLPLLGLFCDQLILFLFVLLIGLCIPCVDCCRTRDGRQVIRMDRIATIRCRAHCGPRRLRCALRAYSPVLWAEIPCLWRCCNPRVPVVHSCTLLWIGAGGLCVFRLSFSRREMLLLTGSLLFLGGSPSIPPLPPLKLTRLLCWPRCARCKHCES